MKAFILVIKYISGTSPFWIVEWQLERGNDHNNDVWKISFIRRKASTADKVHITILKEREEGTVLKKLNQSNLTFRYLTILHKS